MLYVDRRSVCHVRKVQELRLWALPPRLLQWPGLPARGPVGCAGRTSIHGLAEPCCRLWPLLSLFAHWVPSCNRQACYAAHCPLPSAPPPRSPDIPRQSTVKLFCPKCEDVYYPRSKYHGNLDGEG